MSRQQWRDQLDQGWSRPQTRCDMAEAMAWLGGGLAFLGGIALAVISVRPWTWGDR